MAVTLKPLYPTIEEAKTRRLELSRYLRLDGGRRLIAAAVFLMLMSFLTLGQTGRLATQGYGIAVLQREQVNLLRERSTLQLRLARAQSLADIERRAAELQLRPMSYDQARYIAIDAPDEQVAVTEPVLLMNP